MARIVIKAMLKIMESPRGTRLFSNQLATGFKANEKNTPQSSGTNKKENSLNITVPKTTQIKLWETLNNAGFSIAYNLKQPIP